MLGAEAFFFGGAVAAATIAFVGQGGTFSAGALGSGFTDYLTNDVLVAVAMRGADTTAITVPNLGFGDNRDWQVINTLSANSAYSVAVWRRAGSNGADGDLGTFTGASAVRVTSWRNVNLADPIGAVAMNGEAAGNSIDYSGLTLEHTNSAVVGYAGCRSTTDLLSPGLRSGATNLAVRSTPAGGHHGRIFCATTIPTPSWAAAAGVANDGGLSDGGNHEWAVEVKGA